MKRSYKKLVALLLVASMGLALFNSSSIQAKTPLQEKGFSSLTQDNKQTLEDNGLDSLLIEKILLVGEHIRFSQKNGFLETDLTDSELKTLYDFTEKQIEDFHKILNGTYNLPKVTYRTYSNASTQSNKSGYRFYISNYDLRFGVFSTLLVAAQTSPAALAAAFTAVSSMITGPVGGVIVGVVSLFGIGFFADLALKIVQAVALNKGLAIYTRFGWPPIEFVIE